MPDLSLPEERADQGVFLSSSSFSSPATVACLSLRAKKLALVEVVILKTIPETTMIPMKTAITTSRRVNPLLLKVLILPSLYAC